MSGKIPSLLGMKNRPLAWLVMALIANGASLRIANAQSYTILNPNTYASGTDITNAWSGVTLQSMTLVQTGGAGLNTQWTAQYSDVYAAPAFPGPSSISGNVFSSAPAAASNPVTGLDGWGPLWDPLGNGFTGACLQQCTNYANYINTFGTNLLVSFAAPIDQISVLQDGNVNNGVDLMAFNAANQIVGICEASGGSITGVCYSSSSTPNQAAMNWEVTTSIDAPGITRVLMGGDNSSGDQIQTIQYKALAPEIDSASAASGLMLLLGGLAILRGRRLRI
jgi:hypothetical protein